MKSRVASAPPVYNAPVHGPKDARKQFFDKHRLVIWADAQRAGVLDRSVDKDTFLRMGNALLEKAYTEAPSGQAIREISDGIYTSHLVS